MIVKPTHNKDRKKEKKKMYSRIYIYIYILREFLSFICLLKSNIEKRKREREREREREKSSKILSLLFQLLLYNSFVMLYIKR